MEEDFLHHHVVDRRVLGELHLLLIVQNQRIVVLVHEEMLHAPMSLLDLLLQLAVAIHGQREDNALELQLTVGSEVKHEIVEQLISCLRHRRLRNQVFCRVLPRCVRDSTVRLYGISLLRLLVGASVGYSQ